MTNKETEQFYKELKDYWKDELVSYVHYPLKFTWQVKLFRLKTMGKL